MRENVSAPDMETLERWFMNNDHPSTFYRFAPTLPPPAHYGLAQGTCMRCPLALGSTQ